MNFSINADTVTHDTDRLGLIVAFVSVARHLSFVGAADSMSTTASTLSRKVSRLESVLGAPLLVRTTRSVGLTEAGSLYLDESMKVLEQLRVADELVSSLNATPRGLLRITAPVSFGEHFLSPMILKFLEQNPDVNVEADYTNRYVDLVAERYDVAIRIGELPDSNLISRKIADNVKLLVASPDYLREHGTPLEPADIAAHHCLSFSHYALSANSWRFRKGDRHEAAKVTKCRLRSDNSDIIHEAALKGLGIAIVANYLCHDSVRRGELVPIMTDWEILPRTGIHVIRCESAHLPPKVRAFVDFLGKACRLP